MNYLAKKTIVAGLIGLMQFSFTLPVLEAASLHNTVEQEVQLSSSDWNKRERHNDRYDGRYDRRHDNRYDKRYEERKRDHDRRMREEQLRHEREIRRHFGESNRAWERRQALERERHNRTIRDIAALLIGAAIGSRM